MIVVSKWVMTDIDPISLAALIMSIGAVAVAAWMAARRGWACLSTLRGQGWKWSLGLSALFFFVIIFFPVPTFVIMGNFITRIDVTNCANF